jgi:hypothetical protein
MSYQYGGCVYSTATQRDAAALADFATACGTETVSEGLVYLHDTCESAIRADLAQAEWTLVGDDDDFDAARELAQEILRGEHE